MMAQMTTHHLVFCLFSIRYPKRIWKWQMEKFLHLCFQMQVYETDNIIFYTDQNQRVSHLAGMQHIIQLHRCMCADVIVLRSQWGSESQLREINNLGHRQRESISGQSCWPLLTVFALSVVESVIHGRFKVARCAFIVLMSCRTWA